ncbi:MAG: hypothetical protein LBB82_09535 [Treponema sp.]|nr:hypothetical protein [Treponema sp.]
MMYDISEPAVAAEDSPTGRPLIFTANEVSGTIAVFEARNCKNITTLECYIMADSTKRGKKDFVRAGKLSPHIHLITNSDANELLPALKAKLDPQKFHFFSA